MMSVESESPAAKLATEQLTLSYGSEPIVRGVDAVIPRGALTVIIGPNACGKSTLLRGMARLLAPSSGRVVLDGRNISSMPTKDVARELGLLPQTSIAPEGITVADLVSRGRYPHQRIFNRWSDADERAVVQAMASTGVTELSGELVDQLSGGQRQRVWVAMVLAQQTELLLLDEPTTFLDISHQYELLHLCRTLKYAGHTLIAVLHDLNQAARFADHLVVMKDGSIVAAGPAGDVLTAELVFDVYGLPCQILADPVTGTPLVIPLDRTTPDGV